MKKNSICLYFHYFLFSYCVVANSGTPIQRADFSKISTMEEGCNLTFLTPTIGITAAHCAEKGRVVVHLPTGSGDYIDIKKSLVHPGYKSSGNGILIPPPNILGPYGIKIWKHDVALVLLERQARHSVFYGEKFETIDLTGPKIELNLSGPPNYENLFLITASDDGAKPLMKIRLKLKRKMAGGQGIVVTIDDNEQNLCPGESGAPIFHELPNGSLELVGVISSGFLNKPPFLIPTFSHIPRCNLDFSRKVFFVDVFENKDWINKAFSELQKN